LTELAGEAPHGGDEMMESLSLLSFMNGNLETATLCVQALQMLLAEEAASGVWDES
jgi:hypothetical protein